MKSLNDIIPGEDATVSLVNAEESMKRRLFDIGIIPGTRIRCIGKSPLGDPKAFLIRGAVIAIRSEDCAGIIVK